jgi:glycosyltransferase involved in cell wall biosynthesis
MLRKQIVFSPRGMLQRWPGTRHQELKFIWESLCRVVSPRRLTLHLTSDTEAAESLLRMPKAEAVVIPNGIDIPHEVRHVDRPHELRFVFLGRIDPKKGIENLLYAYNAVAEGLSKRSSLTIAGDGEALYKTAIEKLVNELPVRDRVQMVGSVVGEQKRALFENADVVVVPSFTENFGLVVAEALAHGVPVIASTGTPWRGLKEKNCGLWVDNTPVQLASAMKEISEMPLMHMGRRGREWMIAEFSWDPIANRMLDLYRRIID